MFPALVAFGAAGAVWMAARLASGGAGEVMGAYATLAEAQEYSVSDVASSVAWQAGAVVTLTVGVPLVALGVLAWELLRGRESDLGVRALVATALAYLVVTIVEVGVFASRFIEHITERQLLSVAPPVFVAFAVWLGRGMPRPQPVTSATAITVAASALFLPVERITTRAAAADALSTVPLEYLRRAVSEVTFETIYAVGAVAFLLFAVLAPGREAALETYLHEFLRPKPSDMRYQWVVVRLEAIDTDELRELVFDAWRMVVPQKLALLSDDELRPQGGA